jgi:hypothetical protein
MRGIYLIHQNGDQIATGPHQMVKARFGNLFSRVIRLARFEFEAFSG